MICKLCGEDKLSKEFPHEHLTEACLEHALLHCLRCVTSSVENRQKCSQCDVEVQEENVQYKNHIETLEFLFPTVQGGEAVGEAVDEASSHIVITTLSGERATFVFNPDQTIMSLKDKIEGKLNVPFNKQYLLYNDVELKVKSQNDQQRKLKDYHVMPNSTIYLLVLLYALPEEFEDVIFDLEWGYPKHGKDYLDASVLLYSGSDFVEFVDYNNRSSSTSSAVKHSGDVMDNIKRCGHHTINVSMKSIPAHVNKLVFILSAWNAHNISEYPNPNLKFFDAKFPDRQLCSDEMSQAADSRAIIMCCLTNRGNGWQVFSVKHPSDGNTMNYAPLQKQVVKLIEKGYI